MDGKVSSTIDTQRHHVVITTGTAINASALDIGRVSTGYFLGTLDEVRVYSRALSAQEVKRLYNAKKSTVQASKSITLGAAPNNNTLNQGLVGYWPFDGKDMGTTSAIDRSGNNNLGFLTNGPIRTIGRIGQGLSFDGVNDYVDAGSNASLNLATNLTVAAWFKFTAIHDTNNYIYSKRNSAGDANGYALYMNNTNDRLRAIVLDGTNPLCGDSALESGNLTSGAWYQGTMTYDGANMRLYVNGSVVATTACTRSSATGASALIGIYNSLAAEYAFPGTIDDVRIYNRALSAAEVRRLYNGGR